MTYKSFDSGIKGCSKILLGPWNAVFKTFILRKISIIIKFNDNMLNESKVTGVLLSSSQHLSSFAKEKLENI